MLVLTTSYETLSLTKQQSFVHGFYDGVSGFFYKPYKRARDEGVLGFANGCGKGVFVSSGFSTHPIVGALGIFRYTRDGIAKSLDRAIHGETMKHILAAKQAEVEYWVRREEHMTIVNANLVERFSRPRASSAKEQ